MLVLSPTGNGIACPTAVIAGANLNVKAGNANAFGTSDWLLNVGTGSLSTNGYNVGINGLGGSAGVVQNGAATAATLTVGGDGSSQTFSGAVQNGGSGSLALVKTGAGTLLLNGANTYSGSTTVAAGACWSTARYTARATCLSAAAS